MLKITITETPAEARWVLQGRLFGPWVSELFAIWGTATRTRKGRACVVDLNDVTFIDKDAEELLCAMSREGAQFIANSPYIKHVLGGLKIRCKRGLSGIIASFSRYSGSAAHAPNSPTPLVKGKEDQDHASRLTNKDR
jgi:hypothetical protein